MAPSPPSHCDVLVVGSGPAGSAAARHLAERGRSVVLIEAGPGGPRPAAVRGIDLVAASAATGWLVPGLRARDREGGPLRDYRQGRGLGGSSAINGMLLTPGDRADYRRWEAATGEAGWGPEGMAPWLEAARSHHRILAPEAGPVTEALADAAVADGLPRGGTSLDPDRSGVLDARLAASDGRRWSAADAHLGGDAPPGTGGEADPPTVWTVDGVDLTVVAGDPVVRVRAPGAGDRSPGAVVLGSGAELSARSVVLGAGAIGTPVLLHRSGLAGPAVGATLKDHPSFAFTLVLRPEAVAADDRFESPIRAVTRLIRFASGPDRDGDLQAIAIDRVDAGGPQPLAAVAVGLMEVSSVGRLGLDPVAGPAADGPGRLDLVTGALGTADDRARLRAGFRRAARWLAAEPIVDLVAEVHVDDAGTPLTGLDLDDDGTVDAVLASRPGPYAHPVGTCRPGPAGDPGAVVSAEEGRLAELVGWPGIRVADASVFPDLVRGGLQLPATALGLRIAADLAAD